MRYVVRAWVVTAEGMAQRSYTIDVDIAVRPLVKQYVHTPAKRDTVEFSEPKKLTG